jgi:REP element-mobilizing transposase RayT
MGRVPRYFLPDGISHINARGNRKKAIYIREADANRFLAGLDELTQRFDVACFAYCLMPNHYHLVLDAERLELSKAMHRLNGSYARWFNREYGHWGHVFGDRFHARAVLDEAYALEVVRYVLLNPVRAGLCRHPREWRWSSYRATVGLRPRPRFLSLDWMTDFISPAGFADFVDEGLLEDEVPA